MVLKSILIEDKMERLLLELNELKKELENTPISELSSKKLAKIKYKFYLFEERNKEINKLMQQ